MLTAAILFARVRVNLTHFFEDLQAGDPVAWICLVLVVVGTAASWYFKFARFRSKSSNTGVPSTSSTPLGSSAPPAPIESGIHCPVCQSSVEPNPGGEVTCPQCQAVFPSP